MSDAKELKKSVVHYFGPLKAWQKGRYGIYLTPENNAIWSEISIIKGKLILDLASSNEHMLHNRIKYLKHFEFIEGDHFWKKERYHIRLRSSVKHIHDKVEHIHQCLHRTIQT